MAVAGGETVALKTRAGMAEEWSVPEAPEGSDTQLQGKDQGSARNRLGAAPTSYISQGLIMPVGREQPSPGPYILPQMTQERQRRLRLFPEVQEFP